MSLYHINQSPLYKLRSHNQLADYLGIETKTLIKVSKKGVQNYFFSKIKQKNGEYRDIEVPLTQLMRIHKRLQKFFSRIEKPEYLYSGVKYKSNVRNALCHKDNNFVYKVDIKSFYTSTDNNRLKKCFLNNFNTTEDIAQTLADLCSVNGHLPTGSPLSQSLSFFCNVNLFNEINRYCRARQVKVTIYVDDLTFSSNSPFKKDFFKGINRLFSKGSTYQLHKHRCYGENTAKPVTGVILKNNNSLVPNKQRWKIKTEIDKQGYMLSIHSSKPEKVEKYFQSIIGRLYSAGQISPKYKLKAQQIASVRRDNEISAVNKKKKKT